MRYENWDVLLFPQGGPDSGIPLQEFGTACHVVQDISKHLISSQLLEASPKSHLLVPSSATAT